jgi:uncharacterized LabA/DUF88 family protein
MGKTAILVDGGFYRKRAKQFWGDKSAAERAVELNEYCYKHLDGDTDKLYRIFYYDCPPLEGNIYHPFLKTNINVGITEVHDWTIRFFEEIKYLRKFAIRLGELSGASYMLSIRSIRALLNGKKKLEELEENDFFLDIDQKGVDMRIGVDIASLAYKKQVDQIVLISGDSDFIPAAKLARREGIDFILDSMGQHIKDNLAEHTDGLHTFVVTQRDDTRTTRDGTSV